MIQSSPYQPWTYVYLPVPVTFSKRRSVYVLHPLRHFTCLVTRHTINTETLSTKDPRTEAHLSAAPSTKRETEKPHAPVWVFLYPIASCSRCLVVLQLLHFHGWHFTNSTSTASWLLTCHTSYYLQRARLVRSAVTCNRLQYLFRLHSHLSCTTYGTVQDTWWET